MSLMLEVFGARVKILLGQMGGVTCVDLICILGYFIAVSCVWYSCFALIWQLAKEDYLELRQEASDLQEYSNAKLDRVTRYLGVLAEKTRKLGMILRLSASLFRSH